MSKNYPKKIYLEFTTIPPCNYGALWHEDKDNEDDVPYILESEVVIRKGDMMGIEDGYKTSEQNDLPDEIKELRALIEQYNRPIVKNESVPEMMHRLQEEVVALKRENERLREIVRFKDPLLEVPDHDYILLVDYGHWFGVSHKLNDHVRRWLSITSILENNEK